MVFLKDEIWVSFPGKNSSEAIVEATDVDDAACETHTTERIADCSSSVSGAA